MKWILDRASIRIKKSWVSETLETYDLYEILKKSNKLRYDYNLLDSSPNGMLFINKTDDTDYMSLDRLVDEDGKDYLVLTHYQEFKGGIRETIKRLFYVLESPEQKEKRIRNHSRGETNSDEYDFTDPAWGSYVKE